MFWDYGKKALFICEVHSMMNMNPLSKDCLTSDEWKELNRKKRAAYNNLTVWDSFVDNKLRVKHFCVGKDTDLTGKYSNTSLKDLMRVCRNVFQHVIVTMKRLFSQSPWRKRMVTLSIANFLI
jgi:hypothetical protein